MSGQWHPDSEELAEYRAGLAEGRRGRRLAAHVADCALCASVSDQLAAVSSALASAPAPPLPDAVERRIAATLAAETAGRQAFPDLAGSPAAGAPERGGAPGPRRRPHRAGSGRRAPWLRPVVLLSAAAACLLLFGLVYVLGHTSMSSSSSSEASGASSAVPSGVAGPVPAAGSALAPANGREPAASPRKAPFLITASGTRYQKSTLAAQVRAQMAARMTGAASSPGATQPFKEGGGAAGGAAPSAALTACALHLTGNVVPSLVDEATYQGQPAYVIAVPGHAWVVAPNCTAANPALIASVDLLPIRSGRARGSAS